MYAIHTYKYINVHEYKHVCACACACASASASASVCMCMHVCVSVFACVCVGFIKNSLLRVTFLVHTHILANAMNKNESKIYVSYISVHICLVHMLKHITTTKKKYVYNMYD